MSKKMTLGKKLVLLWGTAVLGAAGTVALYLPYQAREDHYNRKKAARKAKLQRRQEIEALAPENTAQQTRALEKNATPVSYGWNADAKKAPAKYSPQPQSSGPKSNSMWKNIEAKAKQ